jgi:hypothetical protein
MKLPNASLALVAKEKVIEYLLNPAHPDNGGKAAFFHSLGFRREEWEVLASAFRGVAGAAEVAEKLESAHGVKYVLEGIMATPSGRAPRVRTIWIIDRSRNCPRLVTAYPAES